MVSALSQSQWLRLGQDNTPKFHALPLGSLMLPSWGPLHAYAQPLSQQVDPHPGKRDEVLRNRHHSAQGQSGPAARHERAGEGWGIEAGGPSGA